MSSSMVIGEIMIMNMIPFFILVRVLEIQRVRRELQGHSGGLESKRTVKRPFHRQTAALELYPLALLFCRTRLQQSKTSFDGTF